MRKRIASSLVIGTLTAWSQGAWAAEPAAAKPAAAQPTAAKPSEPAAPQEPAASEPSAAPDAEESAPGDATKPDKDSAMVADAEAGGSPVELPGKTYLFVGARYRALIVPKFMINLFGDGGETMLFHGVGPEFVIRKNAFEYNLSIWYAGYGFSDVAFKAKDDDAKAWEIVDSSLKAIYVSADFLWSQNFTPEFALNYGVGGGIGFIFGDLERTQAMPGPGANENTGEGFVKCTQKGSNDYCDTSNDHYNGYKEPSWADGGSKPLFFPWLVLQTGLRYKPHKNFVARFDAGFGTSGFFLGLGADYGL